MRLKGHANEPGARAPWDKRKEAIIATRIEIGMMFTPEMARQKEVILLRERLSHDIRIVLYYDGQHFIVTTAHVVMTITAIRRVAEWALLHS